VAIYNAAKIVTRIFEMLTQVVQMFVLPATSRLAQDGNNASLRSMLEKILFATLAGMVPWHWCSFSCFIHGNVLYGNRYGEAAILLQIFSLLSFSTPFLAVAWNALMGLGEARASCYLGLVMLVVALVLYALFIPLLGSQGAALAFALATAIIALLAMVMLRRFVPVTLSGIASRWRDVRTFAVKRAQQTMGRF